jgi:hypothetical protein
MAAEYEKGLGYMQRRLDQALHAAWLSRQTFPSGARSICDFTTHRTSFLQIPSLREVTAHLAGAILPTFATILTVRRIKLKSELWRLLIPDKANGA